jgi:hypothetical protein
MARKTKRQQAQAEGQVETQELADSTVEENQIEAVSATTVERMEEEVFAGQEERYIEFVEAQVPETQSIGEPGVAVQPEMTSDGPDEKPAPKGPRSNRRIFVEYVTSMLEKGECDRRALVEAVLREFPSVSKGSITTFLTDVKNPKYSFFKDRAVITHPNTGKLIFADRVEETFPEPGIEVTRTETQAQPEQPGE